jgi:hypothetical protein
LQKKWTIVPLSFPLDSYGALVDFFDGYITGDTGPLHIAAAEKRLVSGQQKFKNSTAIFSIFGVTPARIYGYDSHRDGFLAAHQKAPSFYLYFRKHPENIFIY